MSRPVNDPPTWATEDRTSAVSGSPNVIEPPAEKKLAGWNYMEKPARQWLNWFMRRAGEWLVYLADRIQYTPISTISVSLGGEECFPTEDDLPGATGFIMALDLTDTSHFAFGFVSKGPGLSPTIIAIANDTLAFGSVTGESIEVTGGDPENIVVNTILHPLQVVVTP